MRRSQVMGWTMGRLAAVLVGVALLAKASEAKASGYLLYDQSAAAMGKASAVVASTQDPALIWYNPAGLSYAGAAQVSATGLLYVVNMRFAREGTGEPTQAERTVQPAFAVFGSTPIGERLTLGIGVYSAFGLGSTWPSNWIGREKAIHSELTMITFNPTLAFRLSEAVSAGVGVDVVRGTADLSNGLPSPIGGTVRIGAGAWGYGANAGVLVRFVPDRFHAAVSYRSRVALHFEGRADFAPERVEFVRELPDQGGTSKVTLPDILTAGVMFGTSGGAQISAEVSLVRWSAYDKQELVFDRAPTAVSESKFRDVVLVRAGIDGPIGGGFRLRGGLMYEQKAAREEYLSPSLPEAHIIDAAAGVGYARGWWRADLGYILGFNLPSRSTTGREGPEGTYWGSSQVMSATLTGRFGAAAPRPKN